MGILPHSFLRRFRQSVPAALATFALLVDGSGAHAQGNVWHIPQSTVRAVLADWTRQSGYGVIWSNDIPDFPTQERDVPGPLLTAIGELVSGYGSGRPNLYCPPSTRFPATAYTLEARVSEDTRLIFVYGVPTQQECRPI